jgi:hypothetical protein
LQNAVQIWKTRCKSGKRRADLQNAVQICKRACRFAKRRANLENAVQIWKSARRFAKRRANLQIAVQIWKTRCKSQKRRASLQAYFEQILQRVPHWAQKFADSNFKRGGPFRRRINAAYVNLGVATGRAQGGFKGKISGLAKTFWGTGRFFGDG